MANQRRLADNINRYEAGHSGVLRKGSALLQGIAIWGCCGRRISLRYTGPNGDYPVYCCRSDRDQRSSALCQEVLALPATRLSYASCLMLLLRIRLPFMSLSRTEAADLEAYIATLR